MHQIYLLLPVVVVFSAVLSWFFCGLVRKRLIAAGRFDQPNDRSLHAIPVPRGGGWGIWLAFFPIAIASQIVTVFLYNIPSYTIIQAFSGWNLPMLAGLSGLIFVSWLDDKKSLSPLLRLGAHAAAIALTLITIPRDAYFFSDLNLPLWLDRLIAFFAWLWFINLTNFMDGIDGITGVETTHLCIAYLLIQLLFTAYAANPHGPFPQDHYAAALLGGILGFLVWNWPPAKLFLGDVGSIPIGYLLGFLMLMVSGTVNWFVALSLPAYYLADATITLVRRMLKGEKFWQAHRQHFYQKAALRVGHKPVLFAIMGTNLIILGLCISSITAGLWVLIGVPLVVAILLWYLNDMARKTS